MAYKSKEQRQARDIKRYKKGLCRDCGNERNEDSAFCIPCIIKRRKSARRNKKKREKEGRCRECGREKSAECPSKYCMICRDKYFWRLSQWS